MVFQRLLLLCSALALGLTSVANAQITVVADDDSVVYDFTGAEGEQLVGNDFQRYLEAEGFGTLVTDADVFIDAAGSMNYTAFGGSSDATTYAVFGGPSGKRWTKHWRIDYFSPSDDGGLKPLDRTAEFDGFAQLGIEDILLGQRPGRNSGRPRFFGLDAPNVGVFIPSLSSPSGLNSVIFAFNDDAGDFDFDDMLIRAQFTADNPVSVDGPSMTFLLAFIFIGFMIQHQRSARKRETY